MKSRFTLPPFLFGLFPVLFLYAHNIKEVPLHEVFLPIVLVIVVTAIAQWPLSVQIKDARKSGLIISLWWILFFSFEHAVNVLDIDGKALAISLLGIIWIALFVIGTLLILRLSSSLKGLNLLLVIVGAYLVLFQTGSAAWSLYNRKDITKGQEVAQQGTTPARGDLPDIYYIILDGYGRADILKRMYGYDNSEFLNFLKGRGFYIADSSYSNYCQTLLSLMSTFEMGYLSDLPREYGWNYDDRYALGDKLRKATAIEQLRKNGYKTVAFSTGYAETEFTNFDYYYNYEGTISEFHKLVLGATPLWRIIDPFMSPYDMQRGQIEFTLNLLPHAGDDASPKFVFAHITLPHPPFVFDSVGNAVNPRIRFSMADGSHLTRLGLTREEYIKGYRNQLEYANRRMMQILPKLLDRPGRKPIIIVQGDHGPGSELHWESLKETNVTERFANLNAYYFPDGDYSGLYRSITPVNSYRVILNKVLGTSYKRIVDRNYFSGWLAPLDFSEVTFELHPEWLDSSTFK